MQRKKQVSNHVQQTADSTSQFSDERSTVDMPQGLSNGGDGTVARAIDCALDIIDAYECGPEFYENLDAYLIERWFLEEHPALARKLVARNLMERFRQCLDAHCEKLAAAGDIADLFLDRASYSRNTAREYDTERFFPGVVQKVARAELQFDELPWTVALMVDRFKRRSNMIGHMARHENYRIALHRRFPNMHVDFPNLEEIHSAPAGTTQLLARHDFPGSLHFCTSERYALVVRATPGMQANALIYGNFPRSMTLKLENGAVEVWVTFSDNNFAIPLLRNEDALLRFRNFLPVMFVLDDTVLVIEYEWNTMAFGRSILSRARRIHAEQHASLEYKKPFDDFKRDSPDCILVSEIPPIATEADSSYEMGDCEQDDDDLDEIPF